MSFFSEDRMAELKELFFESSQELLQRLNEEGLELEKRPGDAEMVRSVRRTVHTLKGDSAACGYSELSDLAHELEDVLTPDVAGRINGTLAEVVLAAADTFHTMLQAYRGNMKPPAGDALRQHIRKLVSNPEEQPAAPLVPRFAWSEYEQMLIADAAARGATVYNVALALDPRCPIHTAALQLIKNVLQEAGRVLALRPEEATQAGVQTIEAAVASPRPQQWIENKIRIPAVVRHLVVEKCASPQPQAEPDVPDLAEGAGAEASDRFETSLSDELAAVPVPSTSQTLAAPTAQPAMPAGPESILRVDAERIDAVLNLVGELIIGKSMLHQSISEFGQRVSKDPLKARFADAMAFQSRVLNDLQKAVMKIRMVPVEQLFRRFPRLVRDVAKSGGKQVALEVTGQDTDLDKSILDLLGEPLAHLVRNAVGHGIETPQERLAAGKPAQGTVRLNAYHQGNQIVIEVADDGRGIDRQRVVAKAIQRGLVTAEEAARLSEAEGLNLILHPGLSTAEQVTQISGRGVGMDVVKNTLDRLKGTIAIETTVGQGTRFQLKVPLTLAIMKALLFRVAERLYAVPLNAVLEITRAEEAQVHRVDHHEVIRLRDQVLTLVRLSRLARNAAPAESKKFFVVVIAVADRKFGLIVDKLVGEEELVIKTLEDPLVASDLVSGASILGDGTVVLILNISSVVSRLGKAQPVGAML